jgi:hypothetical protein
VFEGDVPGRILDVLEGESLPLLWASRGVRTRGLEMQAGGAPRPQRASQLHWSASMSEWAARAGLLEMSTQPSVLAAKHGCVETLQWLRQQDPPCPWDVQTESAEGGHLEVLQWARQQDPTCPWDEMTCSYAARRGHLEVLYYYRIIIKVVMYVIVLFCY